MGDAVVQRQKSLALDHSLKAEKSTALVEQHRSPDLDLSCGRQSAEKKCGKTLGGWRKADLLLPWLAAQVQWAKTHIFYNGGRCCRSFLKCFFLLSQFILKSATGQSCLQSLPVESFPHSMARDVLHTLTCNMYCRSKDFWCKGIYLVLT